MIKSILVTTLVSGLSSSVLAQHHGHGGGTASPYASFAEREIKALSAEQLADLREGRGMGLSRPAELNGYPGPKHVLELTDGLGLTHAQRQQTARPFERMKFEAIQIGKRLIVEEKTLEKLFTVPGASLESTKGAVEAIAQSQGKLRVIHLKYHLLTAAALTPAQSRKYAELRGYVK